MSAVADSKTRLVRALGLLRRSLWLILLIALGLSGAWFRFGRPVQVEAVHLDRGTIVEEAFGRGTIESQREAALGFDLIGRLSDVLVDEGSNVTLGQELARLETSQAEADLRSAQTGVAAARSSLRRLAAEEERARAQLRTAEREATRAQSLFSGGAVSDQVRDEADDGLHIARAELDRVLAQRSEATRGIHVASGAAEQRRVAIVRATLLAPFDGLVTRRLRQPGDTVVLGTTLLRIVDTEHVYVNASIDETMLPRLAVDQPTKIFFPGTSEPLMGVVSRVPWEADRQTHELLVEVTPDALSRRIAIGQRADVRIEIARRDDALRLPTRMIYHDATGPYVYVDRDGRIALVRPSLGLSGDDAVEVLGGIAEGDVVLGGLSGVSPLPVGRRWVSP